MAGAATAATTALIQAIYADYARGNPHTVLAALHPEVRWCSVGAAGIPWAGTYHGPQGVMDFLGRLGSAVELTAYRVNRMLVDEDLAVVFATASGRYRASGADQTLEIVDVIRLQDGRIVDFREFYDAAAVLAMLPQPEAAVMQA